MKVWSPGTGLRQVLRRSFGQKDMAAIGAIHHSLGDIDSSAGNIGAVVHVRDFVYWTAVNTHPELEFRIIPKHFADFDRALHRRLRTVEKNQGHSISDRKPNQLSIPFREAELLS